VIKEVTKMKQQKRHGLGRRLVNGIATAVTAAYIALAPAQVEAAKPKPVAAKKAPKKQEKPKLNIGGSLSTYAMNDKLQLDGKLMFNYDRLGLFGRVIETIGYDGKATTFALADVSLSMGHGLSALVEGQYLSALPKGKQLQARLGLSYFYAKGFSKGKGKFTTYNQLSTALQTNTDAELVSNSGISYQIGSINGRPVRYTVGLEGVLNFGKDLNFFVLRPQTGFEFDLGKGTSLGVVGYSQINGGPKGKPEVSGGVGLKLSK